ncbi:hypothetical protein OGV94_13250 [Citrobacter sp. Ce006]|uniref:hypothetical protein n=1 Tax=Citrobacter TaxID=544 RepID=UPI002577C884|nr:hypothetical protein [Citrobacter sp. Ce006]MDM3319240.1 hypothetical protein [Citrobacter sp. Ce006]
MASDNWNKIDDFTLDSELYYCAFLDVLGYKNKSDEFFDGRFNLRGRYERALTSSLELLENVTVRGFTDTSRLEVRFFSDSIIITHPKNTNKETSFFNILFLCQVLSAHLSFEGLFIRGGISQGQHIEKTNKKHNFSFLSSKALEKAYMLESTKSVYPRILIDDDIIPDVSGHNLTMIVKNASSYIVHFSPHIINREGNNQSDVKLEMEDIYKIYESVTTQRVKDKYKWLLCYYYWSLSTIPGVNMDEFEKFKVGNVCDFEMMSSGYFSHQ